MKTQPFMYNYTLNLFNNKCLCLNNKLQSCLTIHNMRITKLIIKTEAQFQKAFQGSVIKNCVTNACYKFYDKRLLLNKLPLRNSELITIAVLH